MRQRILWVLWPSFLVGGIAETLFFALFDPRELALFGEPVALSRQAVYSLGFFFFWAVGAATAALATFLSQSSWEANRCPLPRDARPEGCPLREPG